MNVLLYAVDDTDRERVGRILARAGHDVVATASDADMERHLTQRYFTALVVAAAPAAREAAFRRARAAFGDRGPSLVAVMPRAGIDEVRAALDAGADDIATDADTADLEARLAVVDRRAHLCDRASLLSALAAGLAHEIRNPLNGAYLHVELAERALAAEDDVDVLEALGALRRDLARFEQLADAFVEYAEARRASRARADLVATIRRAVERGSHDRPEAHVTVRTVLPDAPLYARHDVERVETALVHLLRNAIDAAGSGGEVTATLRAASRDVQLVIEDSGSGPPAGVDVFAPFTTTKPASYGLGLSMVQRIANEHGGYAWLARRGGRTSAGLVLPIAE